MIEYSNQNRVTFGYNGVLDEKAPGSSLRFTFAACERPIMPFKDECYATARLVHQKAEALGRRVFLLQSGGLDCEVMMRSFIDQGLPFTPITFTFTQGLNRHELQYVKAFRAKHGLAGVDVQIDPIPFMRSRRELYLETNSASAFMLCHMHVIEQVWADGGMPVLGAGDVLMERVNGQWLFAKQEYMLAWYWFMAKRQIDGVAAFFTWTPELVCSMLSQPKFERLSQSDIVMRDARELKYAVYRQSWPDLTRRLKYTGQEFVYKECEALQTKWNAERALEYSDLWTAEYADVMQSLRLQSVQGV